ncbi:MAG TPA: secretin N-terminal domain-containing protein [Phycisphaerae bacterium]|nr:secretin N-terminal domain-containing protein [Phycisphaerae bacterium]
MPTGAGGKMITLNFPENTEIKILVEYVSERLGMNILYDEKVGTQRFTVKAPTPIPLSSLMGLFQSVLKSRGLALVDADQPGFKEIVAAKDLRGLTKVIAEGAEAASGMGPAEPLTQVIRVRYVPVSQVESAVKPFLSDGGAGTLAIPDQSLLIISDYVGNFPRLLRMIELTDRPGPPIEVQFLTVKHQEAGKLAQEVVRILSEASKRSGPAARKADELATLMAVERTNQLVAIGTADQIAEAAKLTATLDTPLEVTTRVYHFEAVDPSRVEKLAKELVDPLVLKYRYRSTIDKEAGILVVSAPEAVHEQIAAMKRDLDVPDIKGRSPIRFYKIINTTAAAVLATIQSLQRGGGSLAELAMVEGEVDAAASPLGVMPAPEGANSPPGGTGQPLPKPPGYKETPAGKVETAASADGSSRPRPGGQTVKTADAIVTADANSNTIIVVAPPAVQRVYEQLIQTLDKRRPQVLVEVTLVTVDTSGGYSVGVEVSHRGAGDGNRYLNFSSFGLSAVDADTGALTLRPGVGFNGVVINPGTFDLVVKALASSGRSRVMASPRILVNDNASGTLASVNEAPFTSVNASDTVATTSFSGYASAGTTITVSPHISEGDHLQLVYNITLNSFTGEGANGVPPPRQTNSISSEVTIPDGYAVIVGGLNRQDASETVSRVPILGRIPGLEYLFSNRTNNHSDNALFVFIRPVILRDDGFEDLKYLSGADLKRADLPGRFPRSEPVAME